MNWRGKICYVPIYKIGTGVKVAILLGKVKSIKTTGFGFEQYIVINDVGTGEQIYPNKAFGMTYFSTIGMKEITSEELEELKNKEVVK